MKKMNRSQSSYRQCKTLITEQDNQNLISKYGSKHYASRNPNQGSNSFIETNKQNNSLFQSISQRQFATKVSEQVSEFEAGKDESRFWQQRCKRYEQQIRKMNRQKQLQYQSTSNLINSKGFNYTQQFYSNEIDELKNLLMKKDRQLQFYRKQYTSNEQVSSISSQFNNKIQKDNRQKNLYVKQINSKQIQVNKLQQRLTYHKSQIQTLKIYLAQKDNIINQLEQKLGQVDMKKKKIQSYQFQLKQSNQFLKQLQICTHKLKQQADNKDKIINQKRNDIIQLQQTIQSYQDKLKSIQESLLKINHERKHYKDKNQQLLREISDWKQSYDQLLKKSQSIQQYQLKLKAYASMVQQLNKSKTELISANEKYKIANSTIQKSLIRHHEIERQLNDLKKQMKDKNDRILQLQDHDRNRKHIEDYNSRLRKQKDEIYFKLQQKTKQNKNLLLQIDEYRSKYDILNEQLIQIQQYNIRIKDKNEKLDNVMKINTQLNQQIIKKVDQIQKLQYKINNLQSKIINLQNDITKNKIQIQSLEQINSKLKMESQDYRSKYTTQTNARIMTEDKLVRSSQEIMTLKFQISKYQEQVTAAREQIEAITIRRQQQFQQVQTAIENLQQSKRQAQELLESSNQKIAELKREVEECKKGLQDSSKKEKEHLSSLQKCEHQINELRDEVSNLSQKNREMADHALRIKQFSQYIIQLQTK